MAGSVAQTTDPGKDRFEVRSDPLPAIPPPGDDLARLIQQGWEQGRPAWRPPTVTVPRMLPTGVRSEWPVELRERVGLYLDNRDHAIFKMLRPTDHAQLKHLAAAFIRDIRGQDKRDIANALGYQSVDVARKRISKGRRLWAQLDAWPWYYWPNGTPPPRWRRSGPDATLVAALERWLSGETETDWL